MAEIIKAGDLGDAINRALTQYHQDVVDRIDQEGSAAIKKLARLTKASAPVGHRGSFRRSISSKLLRRTLTGSVYVWFVKPPDHRLTHLLVHGHATKNGGRTRGNGFLSRALATVLKEYEANIEEAVRNG